MGFRFTIESANIVANLTCGKVISCYDAICGSYENYENFLGFLNDFSENMYSSCREAYESDIAYAQRMLQKKERYLFEREFLPDGDTLFAKRDTEVLSVLKKLSDIFNRCKIKSLLLPGIEGPDKRYDYDDYMVSERLLCELFEIHRGSSCLILQPQERPYKNVSIFDAFPHFDAALKQADKWPAVLFWDKNDFVFVPVSCREELVRLYQAIAYERDAMAWLKMYAAMKQETNHYYFHLSDLHFGARNSMVAAHRLETLVKTQIRALEPNDEIDFIVTGDVMDSPTKLNHLEQVRFSEFLESKSGKPPMLVLGNHDVNIKGLAFGRANQNMASIVGNYPQIKVADDIKTVFLLFNSNHGGDLAAGEIGTAQMAAMGNLLDREPKLSGYKLVAVLHHHIHPIERPEFYGERWYKKLMPEAFLERSLCLTDAEAFVEWLTSRNVRIVLHGHKHIPFIIEHQGICIIACGSSTGQVVHKNPRKTYLSYNLLKFSKDAVVCTLFAEELLGAGAKNIHSRVIDF